MFFEGYSGSDFGAGVNKQRRTGGRVVFAGVAIEWSSKLRLTVAASATQAEYMESASAAKTALWTRNLMASIVGCADKMQGTKPHCDRQAALVATRNPIH